MRSKMGMKKQNYHIVYTRRSYAFNDPNYYYYYFFIIIVIISALPVTTLFYNNAIGANFPQSILSEQLMAVF